jgi:hypothetical protein
MTVRNAESMGAYGATWEARGYCGQGNVAGLIGSLAGRPAIVCGGAKGVFEELERATALLDPYQPVFFAANDVGMYMDRLDHWVSLHMDNLGAWKNVRWLHHHGPEKTQYHAPDPRPFIDYVWQQLTPQMALSGYFAMQIAWIMGASLIVLCGCPGAQSPMFFNAKPRDTFGYGDGDQGADQGIRQQIEREMNRLPDFKRGVRSLSGWTMDYFGPPGDAAMFALLEEERTVSHG